MDEKRQLEGTWAVVFSGPKEYVGRITHINGDSASGSHAHVIRARIVKYPYAPWLTLTPAFDFFSPIRPFQTEQGGPLRIERNPIIMPFHFTLHSCPVDVQATSIAYFDTMKESDQETYKSFVLSAMDMANKSRAAAMNLQIAGAHELPKGNPRVD